MAEGVGFEPTRACALPVFKTGAINRSTTPPVCPLRRNCAMRGNASKQMVGTPRGGVREVEGSGESQILRTAQRAVPTSVVVTAGYFASKPFQLHDAERGHEAD